MTDIEIQPRIIGTEMEWPIAVRMAGSENEVQLGSCSNDTVGSLTQEYLSPRLKQVSHMLSNGARYYTDCGDRVEYASPEDISFTGAVINEMAGERVVTDSLARYMRENGHIASATLLKRVVSDDRLTGRSENITWGYHVNLSADAKALEVIADYHYENFRDEIMHLLALHLASSSPLLGQGSIYKCADGSYGYSFGQKTLGLTTDYTTGTTGSSKPVINQRNEPLSDASHGLSRVHVTSMDPSISPWATRMLIGTSPLVLRAIEQGQGRALRLKSGRSLKDVGRQIATDVEQRSKIELADGRTVTAARLQQEIIAIAETTRHTAEEAEILQEWKRAVDDLETDITRLVDRSDAVAKLALMRMHIRRKGLDNDDFSPRTLRWLDREYDTVAKIDRDTMESENLEDFYKPTLSHKLRGTKFQQHLPPAGSVERAFTEPPTTTRAYVRGKIIRDKSATGATWTSVNYQIAQGQNRNVPLSDPRNNTPPEGVFDRLLPALPSANERV